MGITRFASAPAFAVLLLAGAALCAPAQSAPAQATEDRVRVFLDCDFCDSDFLQVETPWVAFVRDRTVAGVHLLLTRQETGAGGNQYTLHVLGQGANAARRDTLTFSTEPGTTDDARRNEILRHVQLALAPLAIKTPAGRALRVSVPKRGDDDDEDPALGIRYDKWRSWVFEIGSDAEFQREQQQSETQFSADLSARRITSALKIGFEGDANYSRARFTLDDDEGTIISIQEEYSGGAVIVKSLAGKWGFGAEVIVSSSTFDNSQLAIRTAPAIEYSVWPYEESTRRQLTFQYSAGVSAFRYREETLFDKLKETRPTNAFVVGYDVRQPWGSAFAAVEASSYLDNFAQNRLVVDTEWNLRLVRGLELEIGANASLIHDQLSIPKRDATPEEILLERRALGTDYRYNVRVGFNYTFGSIFNSVVNPRFGTGPGQIIR